MVAQEQGLADAQGGWRLSEVGLRAAPPCIRGVAEKVD